jgi:phage replication O-like protein O
LPLTMASPQVENGFARIANELLEAICQRRCSGAQLRILLAVVRPTYGYGRKSARIGNGLLAKLTGRHKRQVALDVNRLIKAGLLIEVHPWEKRKGRELGLWQEPLRGVGRPQRASPLLRGSSRPLGAVQPGKRNSASSISHGFLLLTHSGSNSGSRSLIGT